jgi:hypothetical protein
MAHKVIATEGIGGAVAVGKAVAGQAGLFGFLGNFVVLQGGYSCAAFG